MISKKIVFTVGAGVWLVSSGMIYAAFGRQLKGGNEIIPVQAAAVTATFSGNGPWNDCGGALSEEEALAQLAVGMVRMQDEQGILEGRPVLTGVERLQTLDINPVTGKWVVYYDSASAPDYDPENRIVQGILTGLERYWGEWFEFLPVPHGQASSLTIDFVNIVNPDGSPRIDAIMMQTEGAIHVNLAFAYLEILRDNADWIAYAGAHEFGHWIGIGHAYTAEYVSDVVHECFKLEEVDFHPDLSKYLSENTILHMVIILSEGGGDNSIEEAIRNYTPPLKALGALDRLAFQVIVDAFFQQAHEVMPTATALAR